MKILVKKNNKTIRTYRCLPSSFQATFHCAREYAGSLWNGIDNFTVTT
jgi:hypothetical protein